MQYDTNNKVKILINDGKSSVEHYIPLKDVVLFTDDYKEITLETYLKDKETRLGLLENKVDKLHKALIRITGINNQLNIKK